MARASWQGLARAGMWSGAMALFPIAGDLSSVSGACGYGRTHSA
jgi:hypothetical protein